MINHIKHNTMTIATFTYKDRTGKEFTFKYELENNSENSILIKTGIGTVISPTTLGLTPGAMFERIGKSFNPKIDYFEPMIMLSNFVDATPETITEKEKAMNILNSLKTDCNMALIGEWDCCSDEGKEGFESMIKDIERVKEIINNLK